MLIMVMQAGLYLVGCKKNYDKVSIELDKTVMTLFMDDTLNQDGNDSLRATILGTSDDMVDTFSYLVSDPNVATVEQTYQHENVTDFKVTPYMGGETDIYIISNETSSKTATAKLRVIEPLKNVEVDNTMSLYITIGNKEKTLSITPSNVLKFTPETTSEKFFSFEIMNYNSEVASYDNETNLLTIKPEIQQGVMELKAKFDFEKEKNILGDDVYNKVTEISNSEAKSREDLIIKVFIIKEIDSASFTLTENGTPLTKTDNRYNVIELVQNERSLASKEITASISDDLVATDGFTYVISARCLTNNDIDVTQLSQEDTINNVLFNITAVFQNENAVVGFFVTIKEVDGYSQRFDLPFRIILIPETIRINGDESKEAVDAVVYNKYNNVEGTKFTIDINPIGAENRDFYIDIPDEFKDMIQIFTNGGEKIESKQVLKSGQVIRISSKNNAIGDAHITIVAIGTTKYENLQQLTRQINLRLVIGAEEIIPLLTTVYIEKGEMFNLEFSFDNNDAFTEYIYSASVDETVASVPEVMDGTSRSLIIDGVGIGKTSVIIELSNGTMTTISVICYVTFEDFGVTLPSVNDVNSPVSEAIYTTNNAYDKTTVKTVTNSKININSALYITVLPYNMEVANGMNVYTYNPEAYNLNNLSQSFKSSDTSILKIDSTGYMTCLKEGHVDIECTITVFVNAFDGTDTSNYGKVVKKDIVRTFGVDVVIPIESFEIVGSAINVYAFNRLSYYDQQRGTGTITVNVKILPLNATYNVNDIRWNADTTFLNTRDNTNPTGVSATYNCYLIEGQDSQVTSVSVSLSANGKNYSSTKIVTINSPRKVKSINLNSVPDYILDERGEKIPYIYFDARKGLNNDNDQILVDGNYVYENSVNLKAECIPQNAYNTKVRYVVGQGLGGDPNPIVKVDEAGNIIPIANGYCYLYVVAEDWFTTATDYSYYLDNVRKVAVKVADGKTKATAIDIKTAADFMSINSSDGLKLHYVLQENIDLTNYSDFIAFGLFEKQITENNITTTVLEQVPFTGSLDGCFNIFGTAVQYKITGVTIKNTKYVDESITSLYYNSSPGNNYTLSYGMFAENMGELSNLICNIQSIMVQTLGLDDRATTNFGVLAAKNSGLIENCTVIVSNLSGNDLYVNANTSFANIGYIAGLNQGYVEVSSVDGQTVYTQHDAMINNCVSEGTLNAKIYSSRQVDSLGNTVTASRNDIYVGGIAGKNETKTHYVSETEIYKANAYIQTVQDIRNEKYYNNHYSYYNGNITFESEEMNSMGTINITSDTDNFIGSVGIGGIAGYSSSIIKNVASEITINALTVNGNRYTGAENVGGIVGINYNGELSGVYFSGKINGLKNVGGIAGTFSGTLENGIVEFMDTLDDEQFGVTGITALDRVGGLIGYSFSNNDQESTITYSFVRSYFVRSLNKDNYLGDIYVPVISDVKNVYIGGLVGFAEYTKIENAYAYLNMYIDDGYNKSFVGGIVGYSDSEVTILNTYLRGFVYISYAGEEEVRNVSAISNNPARFTARYFYSTCGLLIGNNLDYVAMPNNLDGYPDIYTSVYTINDIFTFNSWSQDVWSYSDYYNSNLPYIVYNGRKMLSEPPSSITYSIKNSTIDSTADLYRLNRFIKVDENTILLFKYDNEDLDSYNLNKILNFTIPPYFIDGQAQFDDMSTIRLTIKSSNPEIASINKNGTLRLYGEGTMNVTIASMLNKNAKTMLNVVVMNVTTGFDIYKDNMFTDPVSSDLNSRLLIKKGTNMEIYPYISGNSDIMIEYAVNSSVFYPIIFANSGEWTQKDLMKSCLNIPYSGTHVIQAINPGTTSVEARLFVYINNEKVYLPYSKTFIVQSFEGLNDFTISNSMFVGIIKDRYEFSAKVTTDLVDRTLFQVQSFISETTGLKSTVEIGGTEYSIDEILDITIIKTENTLTYTNYAVFIEINDDFKACELFFESQQFVIRCLVDDGQNIDYGIIQQLDVSIKINPQDVTAVETMFFSGAEVVYDNNLSNPMYNVTETDTDVITAGEIGIFKVFVYPEFSQIRNIYIYGTSSDGEYVSIEQVGLREGTVPGQNTYFTMSPAPSNYSTMIAGTRYQGLHASIVSKVKVEDSIIQSTSFDGYLYFRFLTGSDVKLGTYYTIYVRVDTYDTTKDPIIKKTLLFAEERIGITLFYEDSLKNNNFSFITSYNEGDADSVHTVEFITRRIGDNPHIEVTFKDENGYDITGDAYKDTPISYVFLTEEKEVETEGISFRYKIRNIEIPSIFEGTTITINVKAINTDDNNLIYYSNNLSLRVVPYIVTEIIVDGVNNKNEFIKSYGGNYNLNVNLSTIGNVRNSTKMQLKKSISTNNYTWWYYDYNEIENTRMFTTLQPKTYEYFTISKNGSYYVFTPNFVGFTDKIYMVVTLSYYKGDADTPAGYVVEANAGPISTEFGINSTSQTLNFVLEFTVSSTYRNSENNALPIYDKEGFENMKEGVYYILDNDITLDEWTPINTSIASLDGNGYEINIRSFKVNLEEKIDCYLGLFSEVSTNTILKNLYITYGTKDKVDDEGHILQVGSNGRYSFSLDSTALTTLYFGGVAAINNGTIYNCSVKNASEKYYIELTRTDEKEVINYDVKIAGLVGLNKGYVAYSRSELTLVSNVGNMAGLVSENQGTLSSSYYKSGRINNRSTNSQTSKVAGVCVTNTSTGKIYYSYVEGTPATKNEFQMTGIDSGLSFAGNIAGFVYSNDGIIQDCYANIPIRPAGGRNAGFVYTNDRGKISCCYSLCKFIYQNDNGTNASDTPFVGTDAQGNVNFNSTEGVLKNIYYYSGNFIKSVTDKEPAKGLTKVQFMEDYYFGEYSFSYDDGSYNSYAYEKAYDDYTDYDDDSEMLTRKNSYSGLDAIWTYDEYHLYPKLVEANNIAVSRKQVSFKPFIDIANYYTTLASGYSNTFTISTNKLLSNQLLRFTIYNTSNSPIAQYYSDDEDVCTLDSGLSTYYISVYNFNITPAAEIFNFTSYVYIAASVVNKDSVMLDSNNNEIYTEEVRQSERTMLNVTKEENFDKIKENDEYADSIERSMNLEYSTNFVSGVPVSEKLGSILLYAAEPGSKGNPEIIANAKQYNDIMYMSDYDVARGIEQFGNYRLVADIDFSNTQISSNAINNVFSGTFDGAGFTIDGLTLIDYSKTIDSFGLFNTIKGSSYGTGVVKNLRIVPLKVNANYIFTVGTLCAKVVGGRVYNIIVDSDEVVVKGKNIVGGVIGMVLDNIRIDQKYYEFLSDDLVGVKTVYKTIVQNITSTINVNATSRVSSTNYFLLANINSSKSSFYEQNIKVAYSGVAIGAVIQSSGTNRLNKAGVYDVKVVGKSIALGEIVGTAIGFVGEKSYVDLVSVGINNNQYINASLIAGGVIGENRGLVSRATIEHESGQDIIDARNEPETATGGQNINFFSPRSISTGGSKGADLAIGGVIGFNNGGSLENSYSRIDVRNIYTTIAGGLVGITVGGEFYNCYVSGSVYAGRIIGGVIGATSTPELVAPPETAINTTSSLISSDSYEQITKSKEVIIDSVLGINKWIKNDYLTFYERVHNSNDDITDGYPIGALIGSVQLNSKEETNSYEITTYSSSFVRLYVEVDALLEKYFKIFDYGNKISSLTSSGVAYSNTQNATSYKNTYAKEITGEKLQNNFAFVDYSTTIWSDTLRASTKILPRLRSVSNLNTKKSTLDVKNSNDELKTILLIDGINGEESATKPLGTTYNPFKIVAPSQLRYFAVHNNIITKGEFKESKLYLQLADNISLIAYSNWIPIGDGLNDYKLVVIFEGGNYQISGITSSSATTGTQERYVGLFGYLQTGSVITNLRTKVRYNLELEGGNIYVGGVVATAYNTSIKNCNTEGKINFLNKYAAYFSIGGIAGQMVSEGGSSSIENSNSDVIITSTNIVSRVQRNVTNGNVTYADSVYKAVKVNAKVGGITGYNQNSIISGCKNTGNIIMYPVRGQTPIAFTEPMFIENKYIKDNYSDYSVFEDEIFIGGIVGNNVGQIKNSSNYGNLYSYSYVGGIAGTNIDNGQVNPANNAYNISECINGGEIYLTPGYAQGTFTAYAGGIAAYSSGSIIKSINLNQIQVKTFCQFAVGGIAGYIYKESGSTNSMIKHCYVSVYNNYNLTKNVIAVNSVTKYISKTEPEFIFGTSGTNSSNVPNKAGLICNAGTENFTSTPGQIDDNLVYGDINITDPTGYMLVVDKSSWAETDEEHNVTGNYLKALVKIRNSSNYVLDACVTKASSHQATYGQLTSGEQKAQFGTRSTQTDGNMWEVNFITVPDYMVDDNKTVYLSELRWNANVFSLKFLFTGNNDDGTSIDEDILNRAVSVSLVNTEEKTKIPITPAEEKTFFLATQSGYILFEPQDNKWEIYYMMIKRSDTTDYYEYNESSLVTTVITVNGYEYKGTSLIDLSPDKDVKYTITVKIRAVDND